MTRTLYIRKWLTGSTTLTVYCAKKTRSKYLGLENRCLLWTNSSHHQVRLRRYTFVKRRCALARRLWYPVLFLLNLQMLSRAYTNLPVKVAGVDWDCSSERTPGFKSCYIHHQQLSKNFTSMHIITMYISCLLGLLFQCLLDSANLRFVYCFDSLWAI